MSDKLKKTLGNFWSKLQSVQTIVCVVMAVDETKATCDVKPANGSAEYFDVRLRAVADSGNAGIIPIPVIGSYVLIGVIGKGDNDAVVLLIEMIKKYTIICTDINLNGDLNGGLVMVNPLLNSINRLEAQVNQLTALYNSHVHTANNTPTVSLLTTSISPVTQLSDLENKSVKHG
jgi:hypothetical protein